MYVHTHAHSCDEHQIEDWSSIHEKICSIVAIARIPQSHAHTEEERATRKHQQELRKVSLILTVSNLHKR